MDEKAKEAPKLEYHPPRLERYGTLSELTQTGVSHPGMDFQLYASGQHGSVIHAGG